jgi:hypothetical protein
MDDPDHIGLISDGRQDRLDLIAEQDPELAPAIAQLTSHLESIHGNIKQVEGVAEAISEAHAELDGVLHSRRANDPV